MANVADMTIALHYICGVISHSGPNGEPLACAYEPGHKGPHSWSTLPTFETARTPMLSLTGDKVALDKKLADLADQVQASRMGAHRP